MYWKYKLKQDYKDGFKVEKITDEVKQRVK